MSDLAVRNARRADKTATTSVVASAVALTSPFLTGDFFLSFLLPLTFVAAALSLLTAVIAIAAWAKCLAPRSPVPLVALGLSLVSLGVSAWSWHVATTTEWHMS